MIPYGKGQSATPVRAARYPLGEHEAPAEGEQAMALLALTHTPVEHQVYRCMLSEVSAAGTRMGAFSTRHLMTLTRVYNPKKIRLALAGLQGKFSIERPRVAGDGLRERGSPLYLVFDPEQIFARRAEAGLAPAAVARGDSVEGAGEGQGGFSLAVGRVAERYQLSQRQAQVALFCAEGMTNAEIGGRLRIGEQTVKFHLRNVFAKFGVRRRTELVSNLLLREFGRDEEEDDARGR